MPRKSQSRSSGRSTSAKKKSSGTSRRGFAAMSPEKRRKIAAMGGRHSHDGDYRRSKDEDSWNEDENLAKMEKTA